MAGYYRLADFGFKLAAGAHVLKAADFEAVSQAEAVLAAAELRAQEIIASAQDIYRSEAQRGYQAGLAEAQIAAVSRLMEESDTLDRALSDVQRELATLVSVSVRKLIDGFDDQAKVEAVVRSALKQMRREKRLQIRVSPAQYARLREVASSIQGAFPEIELIDIVEDASLDAPRIVVESSVGTIDGNIGDRLDDLEALIKGQAKRSDPAAETPA